MKALPLFLCLAACAHIDGEVSLPGTPSYYWAATAADAGVSPARLAAALEASYAILARDSPAYAAALAPNQWRVTIYVVSATKWVDYATQQAVAGETNGGYALYVGDDLAALTHELCHVAEFARDRQPDVTHASWGTPTKNFWAATDDYAAWLRGSNE